MAAETFKYLFSPIKMGTMTVKNRIVWGSHAPVFKFYADEDQPDQYLEYVRARAKGGCGLIGLASLHIHNSCETPYVTPTPSPDKLTPKLKKLADAVHEHGAKVMQQLFHRGFRITLDGATGGKLWSFSGQPSTLNFDMTHQMTKREIQELIDGFSRYALVSRESGIDAVELHCCHGCLVQQSFSPWGNKRQDEFGPTLEFVYRVIDRIIEEVGKDYPLGARIAADDWMPNGLGPEAMQDVARKLEETGKIDWLSMSMGGLQRHYSLTMGAMHVPLAAFVPVQAGIKQVVDIPVIAAVRINDPVLAEKILADGQADLLWMVRAMISDPELPNKAREGRLDDIRTCLADNQGCVDRLFKSVPGILCTQNAAVGREYLVGEITRAPKKKKVAVIGGGPGGMEAARVAAIRGHDVILYEKAEKLGGQVNLIIKNPGRVDFEQNIRWLSMQITKLGVKIKLGVEATPELVKQEKPDTVILAAGSSPAKPAIPGVDQDHVVNIWDVFQHPEKIGQNVGFVDYLSNEESSYTVDYLLDMGKKVTMVTPFFSAVAKPGLSNAVPLQERFHTKGLIVIPTSTLKEIRNHSMVIKDSYSGKESEVGGMDTILLAMGNKPNDELYPELENLVKETYVIGDCLAHRSVLYAIRDGFDIARTL